MCHPISQATLDLAFIAIIIFVIKKREGMNMRKILFWFLCVFMTSNCFSSPSDDHSLYCYNAYIGIHLRIDLENDYIVANGNDFKKIASISPNGKNYLVITTQPYINSKGIDSYITI